MSKNKMSTLEANLALNRTQRWQVEVAETLGRAVFRSVVLGAILFSLPWLYEAGSVYLTNRAAIEAQKDYALKVEQMRRYAPLRQQEGERS